MKRLASFLTLISVVFSGVALAQDPGQIDRVRNGAKSCVGCNLFQADFAYRQITGADLSGSRLRQADMTVAVMDHSRFDRADLSVLEAYSARFTRASFRGADLSHASFVGAYLGYSDFAAANLSGAIFAGANLEGARGLTQHQLNMACGDDETILPSGLYIPSC